MTTKPTAEPAGAKPDINELAMASILEQRSSVNFTLPASYFEMRKHFSLVECAVARNKARELLKMVNL